MTDELKLKKTDKVLEIGTGSGYQAAILAELAEKVFTIEIVEPLARQAAQTLAELGYKNVRVRAGDGYQGWPEEAPFDAIIVTAAPEQVPQPLLDQLAFGGRLILPVGRDIQTLDLYHRTAEGYQRKTLTLVRFVPLVHPEKYESRVLMDRAQRDPSALPRRIGWFTAACVLVGNVVGSGIFTTTGFMARDLGHPGLILSIWLMGGLIALAGALSYSELGTALPVAGGEYLYLQRAYGPFVGFLSGWTSFTVGFGAAIAAGAMSVAAYVNQFLPLDGERGLLSTVIALALLWSITVFHLAGIEAGGFLQRTLTLLNMAAIMALIAAGLIGGNGDWTHLFHPDAQASPSVGLSIVSLIFALYAYSGWNAAVYLAGEVRDPARTIPRALIGGTLFVTLLYLALNAFYFYALPVTDLAQPPLLPVASKVAVALLGLDAARFVTIMLCLSIIGAMSAMVWAGPRVYYAMAKDGLIPSYFCRTSEARGAPIQAILLQSLWASVLILSGSFEQLVIYSGTVLMIFSALAVGALLVLRRKEPDLPRPYRTPLYPLIPAFFILVSIVIVGSTLYERPLEGAMGIATVLAGTPLYFLWQRFRATSP